MLLMGTTLADCCAAGCTNVGETLVRACGAVSHTGHCFLQVLWSESLMHRCGQADTQPAYTQTRSQTHAAGSHTLAPYAHLQVSLLYK